jgi:pectate lyase
MFVNVNHRIPENSNGSTRWINNIIYNWGFYANAWLGAEIIDDINNKFIKGNLNANAQTYPIHFTTNSPEMSGAPSVYVSGNIFGNAGASAVNSDQYGSLVNQITGENGNETGPIPSSWERSGPMDASNAFPIVPDPADNLDSILLGTIGNSQHLDCNGNWVSHRDAADTRIVQQYQNGGSGGFWPNGVTFTGQSSFPQPTGNWQDNPVTNFTACTESLHDGIPDSWKAAKGLSTTDGTVHNTVAPNGYTWLENYINGN